MDLHLCMWNFFLHIFIIIIIFFFLIFLIISRLCFLYLFLLCSNIFNSNCLKQLKNIFFKLTKITNEKPIYIPFFKTSKHIVTEKSILTPLLIELFSVIFLYFFFFFFFVISRLYFHIKRSIYTVVCGVFSCMCFFFIFIFFFFFIFILFFFVFF